MRKAALGIIVTAMALTGATQSQVSWICIGTTQLGDDCGVIPLPPNEFDPDPPSIDDPNGARLWAWPLCDWQELTIPAPSTHRGWFHAWFDNGHANWADMGQCPTNQDRFLLEGYYNGQIVESYGCDAPDCAL